MKNTILASGIVLVVVLSAGFWLWNAQTATAPVQEQNTTQSTETGITGDKTPNSGGDTTFTLAEVATHKDKTSCYSVINGTVYDLTTWIDRHPGGAERILSICGKDGTSAFDRKHEGEPRPEQMLATFAVGVLAN